MRDRRAARGRLLFRRSREAFGVHAQPDHGHPIRRNPEPLRHIAGVVLADPDEEIHLPGGFTHQIESAFPVALREPGQEEILTGEGDDHRSGSGGAKRPGEPEEQRVRQHDHIGALSGDRPRERLDRAPRRPPLAEQGRHRERPESRRIGGCGESVRETEHGRRIEDPFESPRTTEQRRGVLQEDGHPAEADLGLGNAGFVGPARLVERQETDLVAAASQLAGERVVADAASAEHRSGAGGETQDAHEAARSRALPPLRTPATR